MNEWKHFIASEYTAWLWGETTYHNMQKVASRNSAFMKRLPEKNITKWYMYLVIEHKNMNTQN